VDALVQLNSALSGRYTVDREIGAGGMATVYLARDVRHERNVALKVLNPELGAILGVERFLSEIKVTANLQHPNLLPLFDSGEAEGLLFYVMPYVEGESLRARLMREKQLPVDEAIRIATAIASALDYAHRHGVIHRDLKPDNVLLHEGQPLIADFGIALAVSKAGGDRITQTGLSLGTPQYMSPEQATGDRAIDGRTDIYSLGAMLYEMLAGDPPYIGSTAQAIIAKVLTEKPRSVRSARSTVPVHVDAALEHALEKLPADRFATAREFADALEGRGARVLMSSHAPEPAERIRGVAAGRRRWMREPAVFALATVALIASALAIWGWTRRHPTTDGTPARFVLTTPPDAQFDNTYAPLAISHDGKTIVFRAVTSSGVQLVRRSIDQLDVKPIAGTTDGGWPAFSPDDKWVAFATPGRELRKVPIDGGPSITIAPLGANPTGIAWASNDLIIVSGSHQDGLSVVSANGGKLTPLTKLDRARKEVGQGWPRLLRDGSTVVYASVTDEGYANARLAVTSLKGGETRLLDLVGTSPLGVYEGQLVYVSNDGVLMAAPWDDRPRHITGAPIALFEGISVTTVVGSARVALADSGTLVYLSGTSSGDELLTVDRTGSAHPLLGQGAPAQPTSPAWSPDGRRIAVELGSSLGEAARGRGQTDIWLYDVSSSALSRLTTDGTSNAPSWSPDGRRVVFLSRRSGKMAVWWQPADGSAAAEKLFEAAGPIDDARLAPDGHTLLYRTFPVTWYVDLSGSKKPTELLSGAFTSVFMALSRDGKWLAYSSNETGPSQVYVRPFPGPGAVTQVSVDGGIQPLWSADGKELLFHNGQRIMSATVEAGAGFMVKARRVLFEGSYRPGGPPRFSRTMTMSPDGTRLVMVRLGAGGADAKLIVVTNWVSELRARTRTAR
jgi:eukaryotic-like serine/threonine-protein kinase